MKTIHVFFYFKINNFSDWSIKTVLDVQSWTGCSDDGEKVMLSAEPCFAILNSVNHQFLKSWKLTLITLIFVKAEYLVQVLSFNDWIIEIHYGFVQLNGASVGWNFGNLKLISSFYFTATVNLRSIMDPKWAVHEH